jgi:hypothetical protein
MTLAVLRPKTAGNSEITASGSLLCWPGIERNSRISAANEMSLAANFRQEQRKQQKPPGFVHHRPGLGAGGPDRVVVAERD